MLGKDTSQQTGLVSRVLALSTRGADISDSLELLQSEAVKGELIARKILYGAISSQLRQRPELYASFIGQLISDCGRSEAALRALAIRHLCSLKSAIHDPQVHQQVVARLQDPSDDVRLQAIYGVRRLVANGGPFEDAMKKELLRNVEHAHPDMCLAAISVLMDIEPTSISMDAITMDKVEYLMGMIPDVDDAQKCIVFRYLQHFKSNSEDDTLLILNTLNEYLTHTSCAVVSEATRLFLHCSAALPAIKEDVLLRAKQSLLFLISTSTSEIAFACLEVMQELCIIHGMTLTGLDVASLRIRTQDLDYLVQCKLDCIKRGTDDTNAIAIMEELSGWIGETTAQHDRAITTSIGQIGMLNEDTAAHCSKKLIQILDTINNSSSSTLPTLVDMRKAALHALEELASTHSNGSVALSKLDLPNLARKCIECEESSIALLHLITTNGLASLPLAPYVLEFYTRDYNNFSTLLKMTLLSAAHVIFNSQPAVTQSFYVQLLRLATANDEPILLRDRACFQLRLMNSVNETIHHSNEYTVFEDNTS
ncbi:armadillo-type protein [Syncephalis plumigaleata]|nr:armadillo-type protein [Syncephalis plumigaleata]